MLMCMQSNGAIGIPSLLTLLAGGASPAWRARHALRGAGAGGAMPATDGVAACAASCSRAVLPSTA